MVSARTGGDDPTVLPAFERRRRRLVGVGDDDLPLVRRHLDGRHRRLRAVVEPKHACGHHHAGEDDADNEQAHTDAEDSFVHGINSCFAS